MAQQIQKKFILADAVDETKILLSNSGSIRMLDSGASEVDLISLNGSDQALILGQVALTAADKGVADGVATLNASGKIPNSQIPAIAITDTFVVASEAAMLALTTAETGDIAVRTDVNKSFILAGSDYATLADWQELITPTDAVSSVNGQTGIVVLDSDDIAEGSVNFYYTEARFDTSFSGKTSDDLAEGVVHLFWSQTLFDTAFELKSTDDLIEGPTNKYATDLNVQAALANLSLADFGNVDSAVPNNGEVLAFNSVSGKWEPAINGDYSTADFDFDFGSKTTDDLSEGSTNFYYSSSLFDTDFSVKTTDDLTEGVTNQYYSEGAFDGSLAAKTTDDLTEGAANLYYTDTRVSVNADVAANTAKVSADGSVGTHSDVDLTGLGAGTDGYVLKYNNTSGNFELQADAGGPADTDALAEGAVNLYFTDARAEAAILSGHVASGDGTNTVANTDSIGVAIEKLDGAVIDHESRIVSLEGNSQTWAKEKFVLDATDISNGYIDLAQEAVANSIIAFVDRLAIHEGAADDYTVSVPATVSRMTFLNTLVSPGNQELVAGDVITVTYQYIA